jgi:protein-S-isoprenylcysteine O-methyltransferase Ste14
MLKFLTFRLFVGGLVTVYAPYSILISRPGPVLSHLSMLAFTGVLGMTVGILIYLWCVWDFAFGRQGDAPTILVERGTYKFVRNPMYLSLVLILLGESLLFQSWRLLGYATVFWLGVHLLVVLYEERMLANKFGTPYMQYCHTVSRWLPRLYHPHPSREEHSRRQ